MSRKNYSAQELKEHKKSDKAKWIVSFILIGMLLIGMVSMFMYIKPEWSIVNESNIVSVENYVIDDVNDGNGIKVNVDKYGRISVKGENETAQAIQYKVETVELKAGTYTFTSGAKGTSKLGYNMSLVSGETEIFADFTGNTFTIDADGTYDVMINIAPEVKIDCTFTPVIVAGEKADNFFK